MDLYNSIIKQTEALTGASAPKKFKYDPAKAWHDGGVSELVMLRDAAFELGENNQPAVNYSCVTTDASLVSEDEVVLIGPDLTEMRSGTPFARIALVLVDELKTGKDEDDTEPVFRAIQNIDFVKYHVFPEGYMVRTSSENMREQVRVSKAAISKGISFERVGCDYIKQFKKDPNVKAVKLFFITAPDADYKAMAANAKSVHDITMTLSKILEGMPTDCGSCNLKPICDEVEGLKELHFGKKAKEFKG